MSFEALLEAIKGAKDTLQTLEIDLIDLRDVNELDIVARMARPITADFPNLREVDIPAYWLLESNQS